MDRFAIVAIFPNYSEPMHCLDGSLLWQEILGGYVFCLKKCLCQKSEHFF